MKHENIKDSAYLNYLQFKEMLEMLSSNQCSISEIKEKLEIAQSTAYKKMKVLQNLGVIQVKKYRLVHGMRREALFGMVNHE